MWFLWNIYQRDFKHKHSNVLTPYMSCYCSTPWLQWIIFTGYVMMLEPSPLKMKPALIMPILGRMTQKIGWNDNCPKSLSWCWSKIQNWFLLDVLINFMWSRLQHVIWKLQKDYFWFQGQLNCLVFFQSKDSLSLTLELRNETETVTRFPANPRFASEGRKSRHVF